MEASKTRAPHPLSAKEKAALALAITWVAGFVDAVGYLLLSHIYTANMSGNSVSVGLHAALLNWSEVAREGWPVLMFVAGLVFCALIHETGKRAGIVATSSITFALEAALLAAFIPLSLAHLHGGQVQTQSASLFYLIVALRRIRIALRLSPRQKSAQALALMTGSWIAFVAGAASGAVLNSKWHSECLLPPVCLLLILAVLDIFHPIAVSWAKHVE